MRTKYFAVLVVCLACFNVAFGQRYNVPNIPMNITYIQLPGALDYSVINLATYPAMNKIYVSNYSNNAMYVINGQINSIVDTITLFGPYSITVDPIDNLVYVPVDEKNEDSIRVAVIDGRSNEIIRYFSAKRHFYSGFRTRWISLDHERKKIYAVDGLNNRLAIINLENGVVDTTLWIYSGPYGVGYNMIKTNPNNNKNYLGSTMQGTIGVYSQSKMTISQIPIFVSRTARDISIDTVSNKIYLPTGRGIQVVNSGSDSFMYSIPFGDALRTAVDPQNNVLYASRYQSNLLHVIDCTNDSVIGKIAFNGNGSWIANDPVQNKTYFISNGYGGAPPSVGVFNSYTPPRAAITVTSQEVTPTSATFNIQAKPRFSSRDSMSAVYVVYDTVQNLTAVTSSTTHLQRGSNNNYSGTINQLRSDKKYYFKIYVSFVQGGDMYGQLRSFSTPPRATITISSKQITSNLATFNIQLQTKDINPTVYVVYDTVQNLTAFTNRTFQLQKNSDNSYSGTTDLLLSNKNYYFKIYVQFAYNDGQYSQLNSFSTLMTGYTGQAGIVIYDKGAYSNGWRYIEAAPASTDTAFAWGCSSVLVDGQYDDYAKIGVGKSNTEKIIAASCSDSPLAAQYCTSLTANGKSDWYLPSFNESKLLCLNLYLKNIGGITNNVYWSSSDNGTGVAWSGYAGWITNQANDMRNKTWEYRVRAIRYY